MPSFHIIKSVINEEGEVGVYDKWFFGGFEIGKSTLGLTSSWYLRSDILIGSLLWCKTHKDRETREFWGS